MIKFISDIEHYDIVLNLVAKARRSLWIGTADIKDLYVMRNGVSLPLFSHLVRADWQRSGNKIDTCQRARTTIQKGL